MSQNHTLKMTLYLSFASVSAVKGCDIYKIWVKPRLVGRWKTKGRQKCPGRQLRLQEVAEVSDSLGLYIHTPVQAMEGDSSTVSA